MAGQALLGFAEADRGSGRRPGRRRAGRRRPRRHRPQRLRPAALGHDHRRRAGRRARLRGRRGAGPGRGGGAPAPPGRAQDRPLRGHHHAVGPGLPGRRARHGCASPSAARATSSPGWATGCSAPVEPRLRRRRAGVGRRRPRRRPGPGRRGGEGGPPERRHRHLHRLPALHPREGGPRSSTSRRRSRRSCRPSSWATRRCGWSPTPVPPGAGDDDAEQGDPRPHRREQALPLRPGRHRQDVAGRHRHRLATPPPPASTRSSPRSRTPPGTTPAATGPAACRP